MPRYSFYNNCVELTWWPDYLSKKVCGVYKLTSPSGRIYIGQSKNIRSRWMQYCIIGNKSNIKQGLLHRSFQKYGVKNHKFEILYSSHIYNKQLLYDLEIHFIRLNCCFCDWERPKNGKGLNLTQGGNIGVLSTPTKEKRAKIKLPKRPFRNLPEEHKRNIGLANKGKGPKIGSTRPKKTIYQFDYMGVFIKSGQGVYAFEKDGFKNATVSECCTGRTPMYKGCFFSFNSAFKPDFSKICPRALGRFKKRFGFTLLPMPLDLDFAV